MALDDLNLTGPEGGADAGAERQFPFSRDPRLRPGEAKVMKERFKCGTRYYEECAAEPFKRCRELYIGYHWPRSRKWRQHVPVINYLRYVVDTMAASLAHTPGDVDLKPLDETGELNLPASRRAYSGECRPSLDVRETDDVVEVSVDLAGVAAEAIRVLFRAGVLVVVGEKAPAATAGDEQFHLVEREFGRFARAVRLEGAFDVGNARAALQHGELTITLPKIADRRGGALRIPVSASDRS